MSNKNNNWFSSFWENNFGTLRQGITHPDNVKCAVYLANKQDVSHRLFMDIDGPRKSRTTLESPGGITIKCGQKKTRPDVTFNIIVENGKLSLTCQTGDVEIQGKNVIIEAKGDNTEDGVMTLKANSKIALSSPKVEVNGSQKVELNSEEKIAFKSTGTMDMYGSQITQESASSNYGSRGKNQSKKKGGIPPAVQKKLEETLQDKFEEAKPKLEKALSTMEEKLGVDLPDLPRNLPF